LNDAEENGLLFLSSKMGLQSKGDLQSNANERAPINSTFVSFQSIRLDYRRAELFKSDFSLLNKAGDYFTQQKNLLMQLLANCDPGFSHFELQSAISDGKFMIVITKLD